MILDKLRVWLELVLGGSHQISGVNRLMVDEVLAFVASMPEIVQHAVLAFGVGACGCLLEQVVGRGLSIVDLHCDSLRLLCLLFVRSLDLDVPPFFLVLKAFL